MSIELYLAFVGAVAVLMLMPGPNVALIIAHSMTHGIRYGLLTVAGTSAAMALQLAVAGSGMAAILSSAGHAFEWIRWCGAAYLVYLGIRQWRRPASGPVAAPAEPSLARHMVKRGVLVSLTNPKTLLFYGAFFPMFVTAESAVGPQMALLCGTFLLLALLIDGAWAVLGGRIRPLLLARPRWPDRIAGGVLVAAGVGLALSRR